jgi:hypothetical protein
MREDFYRVNFFFGFERRSKKYFSRVLMALRLADKIDDAWGRQQARLLHLAPLGITFESETCSRLAVMVLSGLLRRVPRLFFRTAPISNSP